jgi:hypothetical protein
MANSHGLRTTGTHTGNFGKSRVKGKPGELDLTKEILTKENLRIPNRDEVYDRLIQAYNTTVDPKLKAGLWEILKKRIATIRPTKPPISAQHEETHWDIIKRTR